jgi:beta-mannosidase
MTVTTLVNDGWSLRCADDDAPAGAGEWVDVNLPNHVQTSSHGLPLGELYKMRNTECVAWMASRSWVYRRVIDVPDTDADSETILRFKGIDYSFRIDVDGEERVRKDGMFSHTEVALTPGRHLVEVWIFPPVIVTNRVAGHNGATIPQNSTLKARFSKGWDWAPTLITIGIWDDVELVIRRRLNVCRVWVETHLTNVSRAECLVHIHLSESISAAAITIRLDGVERIFRVVDDSKFILPLTLTNPTIWWPNGLGRPDMVELAVSVAVEGRPLAETTIFTGLRDIRKEPARDQSPGDTPHQLLINGRCVYLRGANWVPGDCCFATMTRERYETQLTPYAAANFNIIRVWGGGLIEKDAFYDTCDRIGLMVMQEFPLACEAVSESDAFLRVVKQEMEDFVPRLNHHPCIVLWTGGNEHFHYWDDLESGTPTMDATRAGFNMTFWNEEEMAGGIDPYRNLGLLAIGGLFDKLDGTRPFQPTSGMEGEGECHGIWNFNPRIGDHRMRDFKNLYDFWNTTNQHFYSESSVEGIASREVIEYVLATNAPALPDPNNSDWIHHKAFDACWPIPRDLFPDRKVNLWLDLASLEELFGTFDTLDDLITASQWLQAEGARYMATELRRKMPHTCGLIWWGANEPWPNLAGNQLVDYFGKTRPALAALGNAFAPIILSLRYRHVVDSVFKPELWISNDNGTPFQGHYRVDLEISGREPMQLIGQIACGDYESLRLTTLPRLRLPAGAWVRAGLQLLGPTGEILHHSQYLFASAFDTAPLRPHLGWLKTIFSH